MNDLKKKQADMQQRAEFLMKAYAPTLSLQLGSPHVFFPKLSETLDLGYVLSVSLC